MPARRRPGRACPGRGRRRSRSWCPPGSSASTGSGEAGRPQREEAEQRAQLLRRRAGREELVRRVREDDEAHRVVGADQPLEHAANPGVVAADDAQRDVDDDDPAPSAGRELAALAARGSARIRTPRRAARTPAATRTTRTSPGPQPRPAQRGRVGRRDRARAATQERHSVLSSWPRSLDARARVSSPSGESSDQASVRAASARSSSPQRSTSSATSSSARRRSWAPFAAAGASSRASACSSGDATGTGSGSGSGGGSRSGSRRNEDGRGSRRRGGRPPTTRSASDEPRRHAVGHGRQRQQVGAPRRREQRRAGPRRGRPAASGRRAAASPRRRSAAACPPRPGRRTRPARRGTRPPRSRAPGRTAATRQRST